MIETVIPYRERTIGAFNVRRVLPFAKRRSVGPFVFVDDFGPMEIVSNTSLDILAHPHIGLATVTYLFSGRMTHRDSLGNVQAIEPGEVNWMTAGRGIVHSERISDARNGPSTQLAGLQTWVALPESLEETEPSFAHHGAEELPLVGDDGVRMQVVLGSCYGAESPVVTVGNPFYAECDLSAASSVEIPADIEERAAYILRGEVLIDDRRFRPGSLVVFGEGRAAIKAEQDAKFMVLGGDRLEKPRFMWWNFVSSRQESIEQARIDWQKGNFAPIPNESGFVPLPEGNFPRAQPL
jgi:redox-sensitive bicupin YhaK (pirin superfamily)